MSASLHAPPAECPPARSAWPLERGLFALAGVMTVASALLAAIVSTWFLALTAFVGLNQLLFVATGSCPASFVLARTLGLRPAGTR